MDIDRTDSGSGSPDLGEISTFNSAPKVTQLAGIDNFEEWETSLWENLRYHGLAGFLERTEPKPEHTDSIVFAQWDERRQLAKAIIKCSIEPVMPTLHSLENSLASSATAKKWNPKAKNPRSHYEAAVALMVNTAERSGLVATLLHRICRADRLDCDSLAAYQGLLAENRRHLANLRHDPGDRMMIWVAINGLRASKPRWHRMLTTEMASGTLDWHGLMEKMSAKACREKQSYPKGDKMDTETE